MSDIAQLSTRFGTYLAQHPFVGVPNTLYNPAEYIMALGGKRMRPLLVLMGYELFEAPNAVPLSAALAIEVLHNFTLVHDDIMDAAPLRRGQATVHAKYGLNAGILSGDIMLLYAFEHLRQVPEKFLPQVIQVFNRAAIEICEGQQMDMDFEQLDAVPLADYLRMIELKTAVLLGAALQIGAILAHASQEQQAHTYQIGRLLGLAFQIQDDWLDSFGDPKQVGKVPGGDIIQNKKTWLVIKTLSLATEKDADRLRKLLTTKPKDPTKKVATVRALMEKYDIPNLTTVAKNQYQNEALAHLKALKVAPEREKAILEMADMLLERVK